MGDENNLTVGCRLGVAGSLRGRPGHPEARESLADENNLVAERDAFVLVARRPVGEEHARRFKQPLQKRLFDLLLPSNQFNGITATGARPQELPSAAAQQVNAMFTQEFAAMLA